MKKKMEIPKEDISFEGNTSEKFVFVVDLMGFKDFVMSKSHREVLERMEFVSNSVRQHDQSRTIMGDEELIEVTTNVALFSDTIIVWTDGADTDSLYVLLGKASILTGELFGENIPFRGALARGEFTADPEKSVFVGKPLINAFLLSEDLDFFGSVIHHSAESCLDKKSICFESMVPTKKGMARHSVIIPSIPVPLNESCDDFFEGFTYPGQGPHLEKVLEGLFAGRSGSMRVYAEKTMSVYEELTKKKPVEFSDFTEKS